MTRFEKLPSAGLPLSVGHAPRAVRLGIAVVFAVTAAICAWGARLVDAALPLAGILLIGPIAVVGFLAAAYVAVPLSRFGVWLDHFLPRLRKPRVAISTAIVIWIAAALLVTLPVRGCSRRAAAGVSAPAR